MNFSNTPLAFGALAFAIPLIIHILNRSRFRTVDWGAMHLLESVIKVNHKRFRIEQLILLLVRCAIPALLAFALARPILTGSQILEKNAPVSLVIVLDNSYSMDVETNGESHFVKAVAAAIEVVEATGRGSQISVVLTGGKPTRLFDQPSFDSASVVRRLRQLRGGFGASDMQGSLSEAVNILTGMTHARRELIVISDFQSADWSTDRVDTASVKQQLDALPVKSSATFIPIGKSASANASVAGLNFSGRAIGVGQQLLVRADIANHSVESFDGALAVMSIDGKENTTSQVTLSPNSSSQVLFPCTFESPGSHVMEVELRVDDQLSTDNRFAAAVNVWDRVEVVLVDGDPSSEPLAGETDFLSVALTPLTFGRSQLTDLIETKTVRPDAVTAETLTTARVVVLANVSQLKLEQHELLKDYVNRGGALLVTAGDRIDLNWYRTDFYADGQGLLPAPFGARRGIASNSGADSASNLSSQSSRIVTGQFDHPAMEFFNDPSNGNLSTANINEWYSLDDRSSDMVVLASLNNGDPLLIEKTHSVKASSCNWQQHATTTGPTCLSGRFMSH